MALAKWVRLDNKCQIGEDALHHLSRGDLDSARRFECNEKSWSTRRDLYLHIEVSHRIPHLVAVASFEIAIKKQLKYFLRCTM